MTWKEVVWLVILHRIEIRKNFGIALLLSMAKTQWSCFRLHELSWRLTWIKTRYVPLTHCTLSWKKGGKILGYSYGYLKGKFIIQLGWTYSWFGPNSQASTFNVKWVKLMVVPFDKEHKKYSIITLLQNKKRSNGNMLLHLYSSNIAGGSTFTSAGDPIYIFLISKSEQWLGTPSCSHSIVIASLITICSLLHFALWSEVLIYFCSQGFSGLCVCGESLLVRLEYGIDYSLNFSSVDLLSDLQREVCLGPKP